MANLRGRAGFPACSFATRQGCPFDETGTMPVLRSHAAKRVEDWGAYASRVWVVASSRLGHRPGICG